jgi:SAM-dependent methyltransferase
MTDIVKAFLYALRNRIYRDVFSAIKKYARGDILDVGGGRFYTYIERLDLEYKSYTIIDRENLDEIKLTDSRVRFINQDAEKLTFGNNSFDTVFCIHMLEHTLKPLDVISEIKRVLREDGVAIFLIPQTSIPHDIPYHYYNFTKYFIERALGENGFEIEDTKMLGVAFQTIASHLFHLPLYIFNHRLYRDTTINRGLLFYLTFPIKLVLLPPLFVFAYTLSIGDIKEVANNILVIARKRQSSNTPDNRNY